jgi:hypothetical protein
MFKKSELQSYLFDFETPVEANRVCAAGDCPLFRPIKTCLETIRRIRQLLPKHSYKGLQKIRKNLKLLPQKLIFPFVESLFVWFGICVACLPTTAAFR